MFLLIRVFIFVNLCHRYFSLSAGNSCYHENQQKQGICISLRKCEEAIKLLKQGIFPQNCGSFEGSTPVICCVTDTSPTPATTFTTATSKPSVDPEAPKRIAEEKCIEYSKYQYKEIAPVALIPGAPKEKRSSCAFSAVALIVGGTPAVPKEFPHMALIGFDDGAGNKQWQCGGSLISEGFVMTAGHCLRHPEYGSAKYIRLGEYDLDKTNDDAKIQDMEIGEIIKHPDYKPPSQYNDIALLKMKTDAVMNEYVRPACLHTQFEIANDRNKNKAIASGWGRTDYTADRSTALLKVTLDFFSQEKCNASYKNVINNRRLKFGIVPESQVCAGSASERKDTCQGDSGGPLQVYNYNYKCMYNIVGVTSFGKGCGVQNSPGVYSRVSYFLDWIESVVWP